MDHHEVLGGTSKCCLVKLKYLLRDNYSVGQEQKLVIIHQTLIETNKKSAVSNMNLHFFLDIVVLVTN